MISVINPSYELPNSNFGPKLCGCGPRCDLCLYSYFCCPCANASARTALDGSSWMFNCFCMNPVTTRWLIRTAYGIPGGACGDFWTATCCPCCSVNQLLQTTTKRHAADLQRAGRQYNTNDWKSSMGHCSCSTCCYTFICHQCAVGTALERSVGMPFYMGCCCMNLHSARNVMRYQYRIRGEDFTDECVIPAIITTSILIIVPVFCALPLLLASTAQALEESSLRSGGERRRYLAADQSAASAVPEVAAGSACKL